MEEELAGAWSRAERYGHRFALGLIDVDHFKAYNDELGHVAGDAALKQVADALRRAIRTGDSVFRYGGEEFVVLLPEQSLTDATSALDRLREAVCARAIVRPEHGQRLTVSAGVAELAPGVDRTPEDLLARADAALYVAKANGRNRVEAVPAEHRPKTA
jgi:diguanylate cyclase (GGDEF)-like protein